MKTMVLLIGEQPLPNLLPVKHYRPGSVILVCTPTTEELADRLGKVIDVKHEKLKVEPYNIKGTSTRLRDYLEERRQKPEDLTFNVTGGTKTMSYAAYDLSKQMGCPFIYMQSEGKKSVVYLYKFEDGMHKLAGGYPETIPGLITIEEYLKVHVGEFGEGEPKTEDERNRLMRLRACLSGCLDEVKTSVRFGGNIELDLVVRLGNQFGIAEVKTGKGAVKKSAIEQLMSATDRQHLGTYTQRFLVLDRKLERNNKALADILGITVLVVPSITEDIPSRQDRELLSSRIRQELGGAA